MNSDTTAAFSPVAARIFGIVTILAPLLLLASTVAFLNEGGINDGVLGGTIGVWSTIALTIAFVGIYRLIEPRAPRVGPVFGILAIAGFTAGTAFNIQSMYLAAYGNDLLTDVSEGALPDVSAIAFLAFLPWGWLAPVSFVATGILLWRTRTAPRWTAALLIAGGVLFIASRPERIGVLAIICDVVIIAALAPIGWSMLRRRPTVAEVMAVPTPVG